MVEDREIDRRKMNKPIRFSCSIFLELVKNGRNDGFGVEPTDKLSISGPESSPSQHDNESSSWNSASNSRSPRNVCRGTPPSISSGTLKRFNSATIFCLKFRCWKRMSRERKFFYKYWRINHRT